MHGRLSEGKRRRRHPAGTLREGRAPTASERGLQAVSTPSKRSALELTFGPGWEFPKGKQNALLCLKDVPRWHLFPGFGCKSECINGNKNTGGPRHIQTPKESTRLPTPPSAGGARAGARTGVGSLHLPWGRQCRGCGVSPRVRVAGQLSSCPRGRRRPRCLRRPRGGGLCLSPLGLRSAGELQAPGSWDSHSLHALNPALARSGGIRRTSSLRVQGYKLAARGGHGPAPGLHRAPPLLSPP